MSILALKSEIPTTKKYSFPLLTSLLGEIDDAIPTNLIKNLAPWPTCGLHMVLTLQKLVSEEII